jgi:hypothetical protein
MKRSATGSEKKRQSNGALPSVSNQRLVAASKRVLEGHKRVQRFAERLSEELEDGTSPNGIPTMDLDPEDSMVVAVERVISTAKATTPPPLGRPMEDVTLSSPRTATSRGIASPLRKPTGG